MVVEMPWSEVERFSGLLYFFPSLPSLQRTSCEGRGTTFKSPLNLCVFAPLREIFLLGPRLVSAAAWKETRPARCSSRSPGDRGRKNLMGTANPGPQIQSQDY